jgi:hypothetical protein
MAASSDEYHLEQHYSTKNGKLPAMLSVHEKFNSELGLAGSGQKQKLHSLIRMVESISEEQKDISNTKWLAAM